MSKKKKLNYELIELVDILQESKSDWAKVVAKMKWGDNAPTIDIRNVKLSNNDDEIFFGTGISLSEEACIKLANLLLDLGYIDRETIENYLENEDSIFTIDDDKEEDDDLRIVRVKLLKDDNDD